MKNVKICILVLIVLTACHLKEQEVKDAVVITKIVIPSIEKNRDDVGVKLNNGLLLLEDKPYSGVLNEFYSDSTLKSKSEYYQGKRQGYYFGWYPNGNRWFERFYTSGVKTGTHLGWFENQQKMFQYDFNAHGFYNGAAKDWHQNGVMAKYFNFEEGKEAGSQKIWEIDGKIRANFYTVNGERHGLIGLKNCASVLTNENKIK